MTGQNPPDPAITGGRNPALSPEVKARQVGLGANVAAFLKDQYPPRNRRKRIAQDFNVSESTVRLWLRGHTPTSAYLEEMAMRWKRPFIEAAFKNSFDDVAQQIAIEAEAPGTVWTSAVNYIMPIIADPRPSMDNLWIAVLHEKLVREYGVDVVYVVDRNIRWAVNSILDTIRGKISGT